MWSELNSLARDSYISHHHEVSQKINHFDESKSYFYLRNIGSICSVLSHDACAQLINSLVTVPLDYCNSILYGLHDNNLYRFEKIRKTTARYLTRLPRFSHISAILT